MTKLERHCRLFLLAYPAHYRRERGEEMLGTLLEATPQGTSWPRVGDVRALLSGGLQVRAALNRRLPLRANVRIAALVGLAAFLGYNAVAALSVYWAPWDVWLGAQRQYGWATVVSSLLVLVTVVLAWVSRRRAVVVIGALPAAASSVFMPTRPCGVGVANVCSQLVHTFGHYFGSAQWGELVWLAGLACLVAVSGGDEHPGRGWVLPVILMSLSPALLAAGSGGAIVQAVYVLLLTIGVVSIAWIAVDARATIAAAVFFLALGLQVGINYLNAGLADLAVPSVVLGAIAVLAIWRLRVQSGRTPSQKA